MTSDLAGMSAILYARVSTDDKGQTTEQQVIQMREWCVRNEVSVVDVLEEEKSAKDTDRPKLYEAIGEALLEGAEILLAWSSSRISRDANDMAKILDITKKNKIYIRFVDSSYKPEDLDGRMMNDMRTYIAAGERESISKNTKIKMELAKSKGIHCGRPLSFCFEHRKDDEKNKNRIKVSGEGKTVIVSLEKIMNMSKSGTSVKEMANLLSISDATLRRALREEGVYHEYLDNLKNYATNGVGVKR